MAEITWKNIEGPSPAAGLAALGAAAETLDKGFQPLHQIIKDHEAQAAQHWDAQKDINTRSILNTIQGTQNLRELNEAQDEGRFNESVLMDRFGAQVDTSKMQGVFANQRDILRNRLQKELMSGALQAADASEDTAVGGKFIRDKILESGGHVDFAETAAGQFMEGNKDRANLYAKNRNDRLLAAIAAVDMKGIKNHDDINALVKKQIESGAKYDFTAYRGAIENALRDIQAEEDRRDAKADRQEARQARKEDRLWLQQERARALAREQKAIDDAELAKRLLYSSKLYGEYSGQGADFIAKEKANLAGATGFAPEQIKYMETVAAKGGDLFEGFDKDAPDLTRDMLNKAVSKLTNGTFESGPNKGKQFNFNEKDAKVIVALAAKAMQGSEDGKHIPWIGDNTAEDGLTTLIKDIAPRYRKFKNDSAALDKVAASFAERDRAFQSWLAGVDAGVTNVKQPTLYPVESDPVVAEYMKRRLGNAGAGNAGGGTNTGGGIGDGGPLARTYMNKFTKLKDGSIGLKESSGVLRPVNMSEYKTYLYAADTMKEIGRIETELKKQLKLLGNPNSHPRSEKDLYSKHKLQKSIEANKKRLKELYRKPF